MSKHNNLTLGIEAAVAGGSLSIFAGDREVASFTDEQRVARAEDLLGNIDTLLASNQIDKRELSGVVVSAGPGSFTGIRIGIATAQGLGMGLKIPVLNVSLLHALAGSSSLRGDVVAQVPMGRGMVCVQRIQIETERLIETTDLQVVPEDMLETMPGDRLSPESFTQSLATLLCIAARDPRIEKECAPIFVSKPESK